MQEEVTGINYAREAVALQAAFAQEGCPVCTVALEAMQRAMDNWQRDDFLEAGRRVVRGQSRCALSRAEP